PVSRRPPVRLFLLVARTWLRLSPWDSFTKLNLRGFGVLTPLDADRLTRTFARARIGGSALAMHRQALLVPRPLVAIDAHLAFDVRLDFTAQIAFDPVALQRAVQMRQLFVVQILRANIWIDVGFRAN